MIRNGLQHYAVTAIKISVEEFVISEAMRIEEH